jgi:hypothetical protein
VSGLNTQQRYEVSDSDSNGDGDGTFHTDVYSVHYMNIDNTVGNNIYQNNKKVYTNKICTMFVITIKKKKQLSVFTIRWVMGDTDEQGLFRTKKRNKIKDTITQEKSCEICNRDEYEVLPYKLSC